MILQHCKAIYFIVICKHFVYLLILLHNSHNSHITHTHSLTPAMVQSAINKIKPGKSDCTKGLLSDNLTDGTLKLNMFISVLLFAMLIHGGCVRWLIIINISLLSILQNKRVIKIDSNNYRAIAISSLLGKLFDLIVLSEQAPCLTRCTRGVRVVFFRAKM